MNRDDSYTECMDNKKICDGEKEIEKELSGKLGSFDTGTDESIDLL